MSNKEIEIAVEVMAESDKAYRLYDGNVTEWQISDYCETDGKIESVFIPEWLALEKGFI